MVDSLPGSEEQVWHVDNAALGITVVYPLVDLTTENGTTEIISGSQHLHTPELKLGELEVTQPYM